MVPITPLAQVRQAPVAGFISHDDDRRLRTPKRLPDGRATFSIAILHHASTSYMHHGVTVERVLTDNRSTKVSTAPDRERKQ